MLDNCRPLFIIIAFLAIMFICPRAFAISEYGLRCEDNKDCVKCSNDLECIKCMHRCWNAYGYADNNKDVIVNRNEDEACQLKRAKWCNAQCWDPDDIKDLEYISTKPDCSEKSFPSSQILQDPSGKKPDY